MLLNSRLISQAHGRAGSKRSAYRGWLGSSLYVIAIFSIAKMEPY